MSESITMMKELEKEMSIPNRIRSILFRFVVNGDTIRHKLIGEKKYIRYILKTIVDDIVYALYVSSQRKNWKFFPILISNLKKNLNIEKCEI